MSDVVRGSFGSSWRLPFSYCLPTLMCLCVSLFLGTLLLGQEENAPKDEPGASVPEDDREEREESVELAAGNPFPRRYKAPELDGGTGWLNTSGPITLRDLRGKVVLLDFWTFCCINCIHVLPDLKHLEKKYGKELVVIGVHSAKFDNEKDAENIRRAVMRYEIEHPVINDSEMTIWRKFGVNSWPTLVLLDPEGYYCGYISGEGNREVLEGVIDKLVAWHRKKKTLDETPVRFDLERDKAQATPLRFPGKVLADAKGKRLFISDSNHNRIVVASLDGKVKEVIGTGAIGRNNGAFDQATFDHPQGMALVGNLLYVADTENHMIRGIDLDARTVKTIAGTGKQGHERKIGGSATKVALNSPWDLTAVEDRLYIAMAGPHQLWFYDLKKHTIGPYAGSGREDILNGPLDQAALAQPSGITTNGEFLYVVDSEGSSVRQVPTNPKGEVKTIVGTSDLPNGRCLFEFGDKDGTGDSARLQHPLGITFHKGTLYVADSYNHKIKKVDPVARTSKTFLGNGEAGDGDNPPQFSEPAGLSVAGDTLYVADTNNHRIRTVDLLNGTVKTLEIEGLAPPDPPKQSSEEASTHKPVKVKQQRITGGEALAFEVTLKLPDGYKLNKEFPISYRLTSSGEQTLVAADQLDSRQSVDAPEEGSQLTFRVPLASRSGKGDLQVTLNYGFCREGAGGLCKLGTAAWTVPVELVEADGEAVVRLEAK